MWDTCELTAEPKYRTKNCGAYHCKVQGIRISMPMLFTVTNFYKKLAPLRCAMPWISSCCCYTVTSSGDQATATLVPRTWAKAMQTMMNNLHYR